MSVVGLTVGNSTGSHLVGARGAFNPQGEGGASGLTAAALTSAESARRRGIQSRSTNVK